MTIDRAGYPFIGGTAALTIVAALTVGSAGAVPLALLAGFFTFFFRDPDRISPQDPRLVLSPADGRVLVAGRADARAAPPGEWKQISIFLSPMDVHVNFSPASGVVTRVDFRRGNYLPAYHRDAASSNERSEVWLDHNGITTRVPADRRHPGPTGGVPCETRTIAEGRAARRNHEIRFADGCIPALCCRFASVRGRQGSRRCNRNSHSRRPESLIPNP